MKTIWGANPRRLKAFCPPFRHVLGVTAADAGPISELKENRDG
jgi:hypothetical protein